MYAKILTLLALFVGSLSGVTAATQSAKGDSWRDTPRTEQLVLQKTSEVSSPHTDEANPASDDDSEKEPMEESRLDCRVTDGSLNPEVENFANQYGLTYESVLNWYCAGFSFDVIEKVYDMSILASVSVDDIYQMRVVEGYTWDQVVQELGISFSREGPPFILDKGD